MITMALVIIISQSSSDTFQTIWWLAVYITFDVLQKGELRHQGKDMCQAH